MPKPEASDAALELYAALEPAFTQYDEENEWAALRFCIALVAGDLDLIHELVTETDERVPWEVLFDPEACPAVCLPYLAQYVGVRITPEMTEPQIRAAIVSPEGFGRGTLLALEAVVKRYLTGSKSVIIEERYSAFPWRLRITTIEEETPDPTALEEAILREQKPIGIRLFFNRRAIWNWGEVRVTPGLETWVKVREAYGSWYLLRTHEP